MVFKVIRVFYLFSFIFLFFGGEGGHLTCNGFKATYCLFCGLSSQFKSDTGHILELQ